MTNDPGTREPGLTIAIQLADVRSLHRCAAIINNAFDKKMDQLLAIVKDVSSMDCFYTGSTCGPKCQCLSARATAALEQKMTNKTGFSGCRVTGPSHNIPECPYCELVKVNSRRTFLEARMGTILNIAQGELTAKAQQRIAELAREAVHDE